jgi:hypothetical protein
MIVVSEEVASTAGRRDRPPLSVECGRRHRHTSDVQVTECEDRLVRRVQLKAEVDAKRKMEPR